MTVITETMRRMDAMRAAGIQPDLLVTSDTLTSKDGKPHLIINKQWLHLLQTNAQVRQHYYQAANALTNMEDDPHHFHATITPQPAQPPQPPSKPITAALITTWTRQSDEMDRTQPNVPEPTPAQESTEPVTHKRATPRDVLIQAAQRMADYYANPRKPQDKDRPDDSYMVWLLTQLANTIEKDTPKEPDADQQQKE